MRSQRRPVCKESCAIRRIARVMLCAGFGVILIVCLPRAVWFVMLAILVIILGIRLFFY